MANQPYDRFGQPYNITRVLTEDQTFDPVAFDNYSPLYLPASFAITYLIAFALSSAMIVHTALYHGKTVLHGLTQTRLEKDDIHAKLMCVYLEVLLAQIIPGLTVLRVGRRPYNLLYIPYCLCICIASKMHFRQSIDQRHSCSGE